VRDLLGQVYTKGKGFLRGGWRGRNVTAPRAHAVPSRAHMAGNGNNNFAVTAKQVQVLHAHTDTW
jgi:hypothetical protein